MPSRMERYYKTSSKETRRRVNKNQDLYKKIYDEVEYTNVEGISIIEKNEKLDMDKIRELINSREEIKKTKPIVETIFEPEIIEEEVEQKNYDIRQILDKAKSERIDHEPSFSNTQYNILKSIKLSEEVSVPTAVSDDDLKDMIEAITNKNNDTGDLLDDLKSIHDPNMRALIEEQETIKINEEEVDKSFFTSSLGLSNEDFEDFKEMKDSIKTNNALTKVLLFILVLVLIAGIAFLVYHFKM